MGGMTEKNLAYAFAAPDLLGCASFLTRQVLAEREGEAYSTWRVVGTYTASERHRVA
jgi:hypothetical protein